MAASLESMMKQFASGFDPSSFSASNSNNNDKNGNGVNNNDMTELENAERALEEMFQQMIVMEGAGGGGGQSSSMKKKSSTDAKKKKMKMNLIQKMSAMIRVKMELILC